MADGAYEPFPPVEAWAAVPFDPALYDEHAALLDAARAEASEEARERAVRQAIRYAGTDTGAIEGLYTTDRGFTRTVAIEAAAWEVAANERGPNAAEIIKDQIAAYEWVLDLVTQKVPVTEHVVRELHAMLCRSQDNYVVHTELGRQERPLPKGEYKAFPNNPTSLKTGRLHHYAPPDDVPSEMHRLVESMASAEFTVLHPVVQAAYVHYALAAIHPFADGNGRTARALASVPLYRDRRVPLMILADDRDEYLDVLGEADAGSLRAFVGFVSDRVLDVLALAELTVRAGSTADTSASLEALRQAATTFRERDQVGVDAIARRLREAVVEETTGYLARLQLPVNVVVDTNDYTPGGAEPTGHRRSSKAPAVNVHVTSGLAFLERRIEVFVASDATALLVWSEGLPAVEFSMREVDPAIRSVARIKVSALVDTFVSKLFEDLAVLTRANLSQG